MKFNTMYVLQEIIVCNMQFADNNQENLLWLNIALKSLQ